MSVNPRRLSTDETFVWGKTSQMARSLLDAAEAVGVEPYEVKAIGNGFIVPNAVWDHIAQPDPPRPGGEF